MEIRICPPSVDPRKQFHEDKRIHEIIDLIFSTKNLFLKELALLLTNCQDVEGLSSFFTPIIKLCTFKDPSLIKPALNLWANLCSIYKDKHINFLKGAIVEVYVYKLMLQKHKLNDHIHYECSIKIDTWISPKEVDVGVLKEDHSIGECFECKLGLGACSGKNVPDQLSNLNHIFFKSCGKLVPKIVSFEHKNAVETKLKGMPTYFPELRIYGRNELT
jgi:hypothetical protein